MVTWKRLFRRAQRANDGALVALELEGAVVPESCACCGAAASDSELVRRGERTLFVGYCEPCRSHHGRVATRRLAGALASVLLGLSLGMALPFARNPFTPGAVLFAVFFAACLPVLVVMLVPYRGRAGHAAVARAVELRPSGDVSCADAAWGAELARLNGASARPARFRERRLTFGLAAAPVFCVLSAGAALAAALPVIRVVNLSGERLSVAIDGAEVARVEPTSLESPSAGVELRAAIGPHELSARGEDGRELARDRVEVAGARLHLYAPGSEGHCFWLETASYGRDRDGAVERTPLEGPPHFWPLPKDLGGLFLPPPESADSERRLTGGEVTVLRQARCEALP